MLYLCLAFSTLHGFWSSPTACHFASLNILSTCANSGASASYCSLHLMALLPCPTLKSYMQQEQFFTLCFFIENKATVFGAGFLITSSHARFRNLLNTAYSVIHLNRVINYYATIYFNYKVIKMLYLCLFCRVLCVQLY